MPTLSIITTVYNAKDYLPRTVRSILAQTFTDFELILVEDGSPNGCGELCDQLALTDPRIRVIHKPNGGPASASNAGLNAAKGQYIGFVDSDDLIEPDLYQRLYDAIVENDCDIAACGATSIDEEDRPLPITMTCSLSGKLDALDLFYDVFQTGSMYGMLCWNKLFKADAFREVRFDESMFFGDDASILHKVYAGRTVFCMNDPLYHYRTRSGSITAQLFSPRQLDDLTMYWDWCCFFASQPERADLYQWSIARYWQVFYIFYVHANEADVYKLPETKQGFAFHKRHLDQLRPQLMRCPHLSKFEKMRMLLFCTSPALCYNLAVFWGRLHGKGEG